MNRIQELKERMFTLEMVDRWTNEDRKLYHEYSTELKALTRKANRNPKPKKEERKRETVIIGGHTFEILTDEDIPIGR